MHIFTHAFGDVDGNGTHRFTYIQLLCYTSAELLLISLFRIWQRKLNVCCNQSYGVLIHWSPYLASVPKKFHSQHSLKIFTLSCTNFFYLYFLFSLPMKIFDLIHCVCVYTYVCIYVCVYVYVCMRTLSQVLFSLDGTISLSSHYHSS